MAKKGARQAGNGKERRRFMSLNAEANGKRFAIPADVRALGSVGEIIIREQRAEHAARMRSE